MTVVAPTAPVTPLDILRSAGIDVEKELTGAAAVREARDKVGPVGSSLWVATPRRGHAGHPAVPAGRPR